MQRRWSGKNVDLELLAACISDFFEEREFDTIKKESLEGYEILAENSLLFELDGHVNVAVEGCANDFVVTLSFCEKGKGKGLSAGPLTMALFGSGRLLLQRLKSDENWVKLEREFWRHVENALLRLANSAKC